jgi:hypothetical protein
MRAVDIIIRKRDKKELTKAEIEFLSRESHRILSLTTRRLPGRWQCY